MDIRMYEFANSPISKIGTPREKPQIAAEETTTAARGKIPKKTEEKSARHPALKQ